MRKHGLFIGMVTLDLIYLVEQMPDCNQKIAALTSTIAAGGPATNAAVAFSHLGNDATLLGSVGAHPINHLILADLQQCGVTIADLTPTRTDSPPVSSIIVTQSTGERAVVAMNAIKSPIDASLSVNLDGVDIVLIDGHQIEVSVTIAQRAKQRGIPVVIDGGSWKLGFDQVLPWVDYAICSANFYPPDCHTSEQVLSHLSKWGISQIAITHGEGAIEVVSEGVRSAIEVPKIQVIDTLGAGDIFHGAFCHFILQSDFFSALTEAAKVAAYSCQVFGTREWMSAKRE
ncbi:MAG: sugar kinase [Phormidesmis sp. CAN_BIN36]|nr:sugar kinase [Phormidesmis sp. CAN_BIN36]